MPALLGVLALGVLALFGAIEEELKQQLSRSSVYSVYTHEFVNATKASSIIRKSYEDELMWTEKYGDAIKVIRQPMGSATWKRGQAMPVYSQTQDSMPGQGADPELDFPVARVLSRSEPLPDEWVEVYLQGTRMMVQTGKLPDWMKDHLTVDKVLMVPDELVRPMFQKGFICHISAEFSSIDEVRSFVAESRAYYDADRRQVKILSALEILENLDRIAAIQRLVRSLIVVGCGIILAMTLGSVAWLEYRQDAYLLALLKSFGAPTYLLLLHAFLENLALVIVGLMIIRLAWMPLLNMATPLMHSLGFESYAATPMPWVNFGVVLLAGLVGVLLAMVPVGIGLRKQPGLILQ